MAYTDIVADLYTRDLPCFKNYIRMILEFFEMLKERLAPKLTKRRSN